MERYFLRDSGLKQAAAIHKRNCLGTGAHTNLPEPVLDVVACGEIADSSASRNALRGQSFSEELQHLYLAACQIVCFNNLVKSRRLIRS